MTKSVLSMCALLLLAGCSQPSKVDIEELVVIYVPYIHTIGGECFQASAGMVAAEIYNRAPTQDLIDEQNAFIGHDGPVNQFEMAKILREHFRFDVSVRNATPADIYSQISQGYYVIALLNGWEHLLHACVIIGVDQWHVYVLDPVSGSRYYTHKAWREMTAETRGQIFVIKGGKNI